METRLKWLREKLGRLPTPPDTTEPRERTKWRKKTDELEKRVTAAEERKKKVKERLKKLRKAIKPKQPAPGFTAENGSSDGLSIGTFSTRQGKLKMNLPENRSAGATISGTVIAEPSGQTEAERANNLKQLESFVFEIDGKPIKLASDSQNPASVTSTSRNFTTQLPNPPPSIDVTLVTLKDKDGVEKAECPLPLDQTNPPRATTTGPKQFQFPTTSQNGRPLEIVGPFDGNFKTTEIKIGGQPARLLAESPNSCLVLAPDQNFGPTEITVKEGDVEAKGSCRNLGVRLDAPKTSLLKGESTVLTVTVEGLKGIQQDVPLLLQKQGVVSMAGGDTQTVQIRPTDVRADGTFETKRTLTGLQAGAFGVTGTVIDSAHRPITDAPFHITLTAGAVKNGYKVIKGADGAFFVNINGAENPKTKKKLEGLFDLEYWCGSASSPVRVSVYFLGGSLLEPIRLDPGPPTLAESECIFQIQGRIRTNPYHG